MEFEHSMAQLSEDFGNLLDQIATEPMRLHLSDKLSEFQIAKTRQISLDEMLLL